MAVPMAIPMAIPGFTSYHHRLMMHSHGLARGYGSEVAHAAGLRKEARGNHLPWRAEP